MGPLKDKTFSLFLFLSHSVKLKRKTHSYTFIHFRGSTNFRLYRTNSTPNFQTKNIKNISKYIIFAPHRKIIQRSFPRGMRYFLPGERWAGSRPFLLFLDSNMQFSTKERDNDLSRINCAVRHKGGWWHNNCCWANLNGYITVENIVANTAME